MTADIRCLHPLPCHILELTPALSLRPRLRPTVALTRVVRRRAGRKSSKMLRRFKVPWDFFSRQIRDSGKKGRTRISGIAGIIPESKVKRQA
jgi:hypothetical protein